MGIFQSLRKRQRGVIVGHVDSGKCINIYSIN